MLMEIIMAELTQTRNERLAQEILRKQGILKQILLEWLAVIELKIKLYRERQQLRVMSQLMLDDIGVSRQQADAEASSSMLPAERLRAITRNCA